MSIAAEMGYARKINVDSMLRAGYAGMFFFLPVATSPLVICGIFVIAVWMVSGRFPGDIKAWSTSDMKIPLLLLILLPWLGLLYTPVLREGLGVALKTHYWLFSLALMPLLRTWGKDAGQGSRGQPDLLIKLFLLGLALNSSVSLGQFLGFLPLKRGLPVGLLGGGSAHIPFSLLLTTGMLVSSFYVLKAGSWKVRLVYAVIMAQFFATMSFVGARSGYLALIVLSPFVVYNISGLRHPLKILAGSIIIISLLCASPVVQSRVSKIKEDLSQYKLGNVNTSIGLRFHMWEIALAEIRKNPLIGKGTAGFIESWDKYGKEPSLPFFIHGNPHNSFLYMMVSFGIPGLLSFCWLLFLMIRKGWKGRNSSMGFAVFAFTAVFVTVSLVDTPLLSLPAAQAFSLFAGMAGAMDES
jgi:O-antigen ligase